MGDSSVCRNVSAQSFIPRKIVKCGFIAKIVSSTFYFPVTVSHCSVLGFLGSVAHLLCWHKSHCFEGRWQFHAPEPRQAHVTMILSSITPVSLEMFLNSTCFLNSLLKKMHFKLNA